MEIAAKLFKLMVQYVLLATNGVKEVKEQFQQRKGDSGGKQLILKSF